MILFFIIFLRKRTRYNIYSCESELNKQVLATLLFKCCIVMFANIIWLILVYLCAGNHCLNQSQFKTFERKPQYELKFRLTSDNITREDITSAEPANPLNSISCQTSDDCIVTDDTNRVCVERLCHCSPDHKWDRTVSQCHSSACFSDQECQTYDKHRECDPNGFCVCRKGFDEDLKSRLCAVSVISELWFCIQISVSIIIPIVCLFLAAVVYYREKKRKRNTIPLLSVQQY